MLSRVTYIPARPLRQLDRVLQGQVYQKGVAHDRAKEVQDDQVAVVALPGLSHGCQQRDDKDVDDNGNNAACRKNMLSKVYYCPWRPHSHMA